MKVEVDVHAVFAAKFDGVIDVLQLLLAEFQPVRRLAVRPAEIRQGQTREIEAPLGHPLEITLLERRVAFLSLDEFFQQVESTPAGEFGRRGGVVVGGEKRGGPPPPPPSERAPPLFLGNPSLFLLGTYSNHPPPPC